MMDTSFSPCMIGVEVLHDEVELRQWEAGAPLV